MTRLRATLGLPRDDRGQSLLEFAILVPLLLLLLVGVFEFGRAWNVYQVVVNAAREGGRVAALPTGFANADSVRRRISSHLRAARLDPGSAEVALEDVDGRPGTIAVVTVSYPYEFRAVGPLARLLAAGSGPSGTVVLRSTAQMRNE